MSTEMARQVAAYERLRPQIVAAHKSGWALIVREKLVKIFDDFQGAAVYADKHHPQEQVLIRNTSEQRGTVPFIISVS